jgi:hypothetical protein
MDIASALALVWQEVNRSSARRVAEKINVPRSALTRWKQGGVPLGEAREKLLAWAESLPPRPAMPAEDETIALAMEQTGANLVRLAEIRGYARSVLSMMRAVTDEQQRVVDALEPYAAAEGRVMVGRVTKKDREELLTAVEVLDADLTRPRKARRRASEG